MLVSPKIKGKARQTLIEAARRGEDLDEDKARHIQVIEYEVPGRDGDGDGKGELIAKLVKVETPGEARAAKGSVRWTISES